MNYNHRFILNKLRERAYPVFSLAYHLRIPEASIRRLVGELRRMGWKITTKDIGAYFRVYSLKG